MHALVVYESYFGNTRAVAEAVARGLRRRVGVAVEVVEVGLAPADPGPRDLLVVGGPIHAWSMTREGTRAGARQDAARAGLEPVSKGLGVREWIAALPRAREGTAAATFDTAMKSKWFPVGSAAKPEKRGLERHGYWVPVEPEHFFVVDSPGPLAEGELARAEEWGAHLIDALGVKLRLTPVAGLEHA